ncbi:MAG: hypothetical protein OXL95_06625, partial [Nitrospira sp.]|nr:hypothetical protein [Nitrospira sp.]
LLFQAFARDNIAVLCFCYTIAIFAMKLLYPAMILLCFAMPCYEIAMVSDDFALWGPGRL